LSLAAISVDRYLAISRPLSYGKVNRTKALALKIICGVWCTSFLISILPIIGW